MRALVAVSLLSACSVQAPGSGVAPTGGTGVLVAPRAT